MICPSCQINAVISEQLYGALYTCSGCQAVYFINFEGQPEFGEVPSGVLSDIISEPVAFDNGIPQADQPPDNFETTFESSLEPLVDSVNMVDFDNKLDNQFNFQSENQMAPIDSLDGQNIEMPNLDFLNNEVNPFEQQQLDSDKGKSTGKSTGKDTERKDPNSFSEAAKEISEFGNTDSNLNGLSYDLYISGIDSQETMRLFMEAIGDSKFGWDANELFRTIKNGKINFSKLSPVKAYILAKRLRFLDIEKNWKQNAVL